MGWAAAGRLREHALSYDSRILVWANVLPGLPNHDLETKPLFFNKLLEFRSLATVVAGLFEL